MTTLLKKKKNNEEHYFLAALNSLQHSNFSLQTHNDEFTNDIKKSLKPTIPVITKQRIRENIMMGLTSIVTKFYGRWALLNLISYSSYAAYIASNFLYTIPQIVILGTIARGFFEACNIIHKARTEEELSISTAISLLAWRDAQLQNQMEFMHTVNTQLFTKDKAKQCVKSGAKLATVYTAWSIATFALKVLLALVAIAPCWQAVVVIAGASIVTMATLAIINYCIDKRENCVQDGAIQGAAEGVLWSELENEELHQSATIGLWGDCTIVSLGVSFIYAAAGVISNWNKRMTFPEADVTERFKGWSKKQLSEKNIKAELKTMLSEKGYDTYWHRLTGSYNYALRTAMKTVKLYFLDKYTNNPSRENKHNARTVSKVHRHFFSWGRTSSLTLFDKINSNTNSSQYKDKLQKILKQQSLNYVRT